MVGKTQPSTGIWGTCQCFHSPSLLRTQVWTDPCGMRPDVSQGSGDPGISDIRDAGRGGSRIKFQAGLFCKFCLSWTQKRKARAPRYRPLRGERPWTAAGLSFGIHAWWGMEITRSPAWQPSCCFMRPPRCPFHLDPESYGASGKACATFTQPLLIRNPAGAGEHLWQLAWG